MSRFFEISPLEEARFGVRSALAQVDSLDALDQLEERCSRDGITFLVTRVATEALDVVQEMEFRGHFLTDTILYFEKDLLTQDLPALDERHSVRPLREGDADKVRHVAALAFAGYQGHYHADPLLAERDCDEIYPDWAFRGCSDRSVADQVLVAEERGNVIGFGLVRLRSQDVGQGTLYGVHTGARRRGVYRALVIAAMTWAREHGAVQMLHSTQITNRASQKVWARLGFEVSSSVYTLHKWFERD